MRAILTDSQLQILKDVNRFSTLKRYHGLLPEKFAVFYDQQALEDLMARCLIEEGMVVSRCGAKLHGFRLTETCRAGLKAKNVNLEPPDARLADLTLLPGDDLSAEQLSILRDVFHYTHLRKFRGITPKAELEEVYSKKDIKSLYNLGLILYIKLKGIRDDRNRKGYVLSDLGRKVLKQIEAKR